jgi:hypothetical protein
MTMGCGCGCGKNKNQKSSRMPQKGSTSRKEQNYHRDILEERASMLNIPHKGKATNMTADQIQKLINAKRKSS